LADAISNTGKASAHIPCASSSILACEEHGIYVLAGCGFLNASRYSDRCAIRLC
jgi:hypothetical protein